jgi:prepilin-type N-terminal cleavage/methylation domain-containing protein
MKNNKGFTLVELLVVITIIAILAGLAFPAITGALEAAKKAEATAMCTQLKTAFTSYLNEYGAWPSGWTGDQELNTGEATTINILVGEDNTNNPRQTVYMEFATDTYVDPNREDPSLGINDPWNNPYYITVDADYDNRVESPDNKNIRTSVIVWSNGKDGEFDAKDPRSW